jgi:hypothetical protein
MKYPVRRLPEPDEYGNYWLGARTYKPEEGQEADPAVFPSKVLEGEVVRPNGLYIVFLGSRLGFLFDRQHLVRFKTPLQALAAINKVVPMRAAS